LEMKEKEARRKKFPGLRRPGEPIKKGVSEKKREGLTRTTRGGVEKGPDKKKVSGKSCWEKRGVVV